MELRQLRYFIAVANERNFTRAAEVLGMAQPPLSRQIRQLEEEIGESLIDREERPITMTEAGRLFYEQALQVLASVEQLRMRMRRHAETGRRRFVIGFVGSAIYGPMPQLIRHFRAAAPEIDVNLLEMTTLEQIDGLKEGRIDIGIGRLRIDDPAIRRDVLLEEELVVALPIGHRLSRSAGRVPLAALVGDTLIIYPRQPRPSYADQILSLFRDHGLEPRLIQEVRDLQAAIGLVAAEAGVSIVPTSIQRLQRDDIVYRQLSEKNAFSPILMSWREADGSPEVALLKSLSQNIFGANSLDPARRGTERAETTRKSEAGDGN
jgi:DNA-binding transcriptional LysR family regulator